ncbi:hypothetical protein dsx2_2573 [Desulfovibrio sp. X2]|uniref:hypothetical protein n=1 Tax=Desulfovibrio sp. X2 TaxID=941449 RepID=UPI0003589D72|nr:hypothetical protein [Desulfovibrio sp. X2]EPR42656.1 hypothetical protein dsx2_2573 [Desulfovibrio sp. X2]
MSEKIKMLDDALAMSEAELGFLAEGDFEKAEESSARRGEIIRQVLSMKDETSPDALLDKLNQLKNMQGRLTAEAKRLHAELKEDLVRVRQETGRFGGYKQAAGMRSPVQSRYISKRG